MLNRPPLVRQAERFVVFIALCALLAACSQQLTPQDVADRFWRAVVGGHPSKIRRYVLKENQEQLRSDTEILPVASYALGRILIDGGRANIETQLVLDGDTPVPLTIETRMVLENDRWRVDYQATVDEISTRSELAQVIGKIGALGDTLKQGIEQSVDEMTRALPAIEQELSKLESQIKQAMPELRNKLEQFSRRLEEALKVPPPNQAEDQPAADEGTIAL